MHSRREASLSERVAGALGDIGSSTAGAIVVGAGELVSVVQRAISLQARGRELTHHEVSRLQRIFRDSVAYPKVRLIEGRAGLFDLNARPFTLGNTIYLKGRDVGAEPGLLVHECTHVWQYQHQGARYASDALYAQWLVDDAYSWQAEVARGNEDWRDFNKEAQAAFLQDIYLHGELLREGTVVSRGNGAFYDADGVTTTGRFVASGTDHTERADAALRSVRAAGSQRPTA